MMPGDADISQAQGGSSLAQRIKAEALGLGFDLCGIGPVDPPRYGAWFSQWLAEGKAGDMEPWMLRQEEDRLQPQRLLPGAQSVVVVGMNYFQEAPERRGKIARYALGKDYHDLMKAKLKALDGYLQQAGGVQRCAVDTSAVMEKPMAVRAGLGWQAKSTMVIHPKWGTWFFLAEVLTTLWMPRDEVVADHCGKCARCVEVCPTGAITGPYQLDARRCISYLTIEHQGAIPEELRDLIGDHLYGCDDCLDVCPWNRWARVTRESEFRAIARPDLTEMLGWDDARFRKEFRGTAIFRLKRARWLRNICVVLGNVGRKEDMAALEAACHDGDPLVEEHARWALAKIQKSACGSKKHP
ncbi:MAG: tRNA epoxyqueuosine(34) reductase QueG [Candidatus Methylacidiphilales bacterium]